MVQSIVTAIEMQILPCLQGETPFHAVAIDKKSRFLSLPAAAFAGGTPRFRRVMDGDVRWQKDDAFTLAVVLRGEADFHVARRCITCGVGHFVLLFPTAWRPTGSHWFGPSDRNTTGHILWLTLKPGMVVCHSCHLQDGMVHESKALFVPDNRLHPLVPQLSEGCNETQNPDIVRQLL